MGQFHLGGFICRGFLPIFADCVNLRINKCFFKNRAVYMALKLFPHNQIAYDAAMELLKDHGKAAVIHPTGTGKSFIAFQLALKHPNDAVVWLAPSEYIFQTQIQNLRKAMPMFELGMLANVRFMTYARLMKDMGRISGFAPKWIVLDEFHRAGSPQWGKGVQMLIDAYPNAGLLGLTATKIRYLDDRRDMARELFEGHIASEMSLGEAIARGMLPAPKYIVSLYSYRQEWSRLQRRLQKEGNPKLFREQEQLMERLKRALEQADGLDQVFKRHMRHPRGRYLVFCSGKGHMEEMMEKALQWFSKMDAEPHLYSVTYDDPDAKKTYERFQKDNSGHLRLLFSIDMLNEGVHLEGLDGVILLRPTVSPILYLQQIGRALAAGRKEEPVIFDIVDNFDGLRSIDGVLEDVEAYFSRTPGIAQEREKILEAFCIIDEARDCREIFRKISQGLSASWDSHYLEARDYYRKNGHLRVPKSFVSPSGLSLGAWLMAQRRAFMGRSSGSLDEAQVERLNAIGMEWETGFERGFQRGVCALQEYVREHGDADVAVSYASKDGFPLGKWVSNLRQRKKGASGKPLTEVQIEKLAAIGMIWDRAQYQWERNFKRANDYFLEHGNLNVPRSFVAEDGTALGVWVENQRGAYTGKKKGAAPLTKGQAERLEGIGMDWGFRQEMQWEERYRLAKLYYKSHGDLKVPASYVTEGGVRLGRWLSRQREKARKQALSQEQVALLRGIGFERQ